MSFPSAIKNLESLGVTPATATSEQADQALLDAIKTDTPYGFRFSELLVHAWTMKLEEAGMFVRKHMHEFGHEIAHAVLRHEWLPSGALKIDVDPGSVLGAQIMRLKGTDVARRVLEAHFGTSFALANCCGDVVGKDKKSVEFSAADQIRWQNSIDC